MKHSLIGVTLALLCAATPGQAQTVLPDPQPAPVVTSSPPILSVSLPSNARLRLDMDAQDDDMLGVVKSFLRGFNGANLKQIVGLANAAGEAKAPSAGPTTDVNSAGALAILSDADLKTMLADIHHLRLVVFETPNNYGNRSAQIKSSNSVLNYYSAAYLTREGGRRMLRADIDEVQMIGVSFPSGGFAMVLSGPGFGVVMRGDGYPNLESIGPLVMGATLFGTGRLMGR